MGALLQCSTIHFKEDVSYHIFDVINILSDMGKEKRV